MIAFLRTVMVCVVFAACYYLGYTTLTVVHPAITFLVSVLIAHLVVKLIID